MSRAWGLTVEVRIWEALTLRGLLSQWVEELPCTIG